MHTLGKDFKAAFSSIWAQIGMLISAVAVFNFLTEALQLGLSEFFARVLSVFRFVFHPVVDVLTFWLPFELSDLWKDGIVLWLALGGATARAFVAYRGTIAQSQDTPNNRSFNLLARSRTLWPVGVLLCLLVWPLMLPIFFNAPIVVRLSPVGHTPRRDNRYECVNQGDWLAQKIIWPGTALYECDLRTVFALQVAAVALVVGGLILINGAGVG